MTPLPLREGGEGEVEVNKVSYVNFFLLYSTQVSGNKFSFILGDSLHNFTECFQIFP